jgi:hypothetical protein
MVEGVCVECNRVMDIRRESMCATCYSKKYRDPKKHLETMKKWRLKHKGYWKTYYKKNPEKYANHLKKCADNKKKKELQ